MYTVYILECSDGSLYTGITTNLARRFAEHQAGTASKYTRAHGVKKIVYSETCSNRSQASKREAAIKQMNRQQKQAVIKGLA